MAPNTPAVEENNPSSIASPRTLRRQQKTELGECIGNGSYGKVYKAKWTRNDVTSDVAVKIFPLDVVPSALAFEAEARMSVLLADNPHCVKIKQAYVENKQGYIVMDLLAGDLMNIKSSLKFNEKDCGVIFKQIFEGIKLLHSKRFVHMDIKPDNILIDSNNTPYLADFGSSAKIPQGGKFKQATGTAEFAAPEVLSGAAYNPFPADIWSLGVVLYSVLTGKYPRIKKEQYTRNKKLSDACNDLLDSMLQHNPVMRPRIQELVNNPWFPAESSPSGLSLSLPIKVNADVCESPRRGKSPRRKKTKTPRKSHSKTPRKSRRIVKTLSN